MTQVDSASRFPRAAGPLPLETSYWDPNLAHGIRHNLGTGPRYNMNTATAAVTSSNCASRRHDIQSPGKAARVTLGSHAVAPTVHFRV